MCGIFGTISNNYDTKLGEKVSKLLWHRGPDDRGVFAFPEGMILNTRLAIVDLSKKGHQPLQSNDGKISIVFNGEIYNFRELKEELKNTYNFKTNTDTEVIIAAYKKWQEKCLSRLRGMFAFGLWDETEKKLFCATDRFSIKQLYYYHDKDKFVFSSEIKPIAASGAKLLPNDEAIYDFLTFGLQDYAKETFFKNIFQLSPAHYLVFQKGKLVIKKYWDIEENILKVEKKEKNLLEQIDNKLKEVVNYHLVADVEVGLSLSSGLDSSLLRGLVAGLIPSSERLKCFNFGFVNTPYDESRRLAVLKSKKCQVFVTPVKADNFFENYSKLIGMVEEPISGLGTYGYWLNSKTVREKGIKVLLDGQGGDEIFGGYKYYYYHRFKELYEKKLFKELKEEIAAFNKINKDNIKFPSDDFKDFLRKNTVFSAMKATDATFLGSDYLAGDFKKSFAGRKIKPADKFKSSFRNAAYNDLLSFKIPKLLRFQDKAAMANGVEVRVPYLDHTLVELAFSIPSGFLMKEGTSKYLVKKISQRYLSNELMKTPKLYVSTPQREWIKKDLKRGIIEMIEDSILAKEGYIDKRKLKIEYGNYLGQKDLGNSFFAWKFFSLELWYRNFIA